MDDTWTLSSSSGSESDDDRPISAFRTDSQYYQHFQNGDYGENWPCHILDPNNQHTTNGFANSSIIGDANTSLPNGHASFAEISHIYPTETPRIVSPSIILGDAPHDIVLIDEGGKFRPMRVITKEKLLAPRKTPERKELKPIISKTEPNIEHEDENVPPREIPLEIIDFIHMPTDPRRKERDDYGDEDAAYEGLPLPRFWRETVLQAAQNRNRERNAHLDGSFKRSVSYVREKLVQKSQRLSMVAPKRTDPRLEKTLFGPPRKIASPPKALNRSQPVMKSVFEDENLDGVSSDSSNFSSSASSVSPSFGSLPSVGEDTVYNFSAPNSAPNTGDPDFLMDSLSDSDEDCSFAAFTQKTASTQENAPTQKCAPAKKRKKAAAKSKPAAKRTKPNLRSTAKKVPALKLDFKRKRVVKTENKTEKIDLFGTPPRVDKASILSALTDDTSDEQENILANTNIMPVKSPPKKAKKVTPKTKKVVHNLNMVDKTSTTTTTTVATEILPPERETKVSITVEVSDGTSTDDPLNNVIDVKTSQNSRTKHNESISEKSNSSIGSIEQRLAEMTSPVKTAAEVRAEQQLIDKLNANAIDENNASQIQVQANHNDSTQPNQQNQTGIVESAIAVAEGSVAQIFIGSGQAKSDPMSFDVIPSQINGDKIGEAPDIFSTHSAMDNGSVIRLKNGQEKETSPSKLTASESIIHILNGNDQVQNIQPNAPTPIHDQTNDNPQAVNGNLSFELPDIAANAEIFTPSENLNFDDYTNVLESLLLNPNDIGNIIEATLNEKDVNGNVAAHSQPPIDDMSDDDFEDDQPCSMDELILPNSDRTTDRNDDDQMKTKCRCDYNAQKGWKQLTKHYVRQHPAWDMPNSRLSKHFNTQELMMTTFTPIVTKSPTGMLIQSICYICNASYNMCSEKWLMHFIAHTGEFEFRCNKCRKSIMQDLHKACNSNSNERINGPHAFVDNVLYGFVCGLPKCNYIQLSKKNLTAHLENKHQLITGDGNIIEITLLKSVQPTELFEDTKNNTSLVEAKQRISFNYQPNRYINFEPVEITDDDSDLEMRANNAIASIDLTLSDDDD